jgi:NADH dehydrogenase/NADH:ubiquinone oxidoreductase subunit G
MGGVSVSINGSRVVAVTGMTILQVAQDNNIDIPTLCYLKEFSPIGACRLCVVEIEGSRTLVGSCHTPVTEGMIIYTHSPKVLQARKVLVELMLASHPDSCLICDEANRCELRRIAADLDIGLPRFRLKKHYYPVDDSNPGIVRDMSKCILCRRCTNVCTTETGERLFGIAYRGFNSKVVYGLDQPLSDETACGNFNTCISSCPTGALTKPAGIGRHKEGPVLFVKD